MVKPDWGLKRTCQSCGQRFYDLSRSPIRCPKCGVTFDPEATLKTRRTKTIAQPERAAPVPVEAEELEPVAADAEEAGADAEEEEAVIEDTSELGEDKEDVAEVIDKVDEEGEER